MKTLTDLVHDDLFPPARLDRMRQHSSQVEMTHFIRAYYRRIHLGRSVPYHWHKFASRILLNAAESAYLDYEKYKGPLADVMGLNDYRSESLRNDYICISVQQYLDTGVTRDMAFKKVGKRLKNSQIDIEPESIFQVIWPDRDEEWIKAMATELPDADFIAFLKPYTHPENQV